MRWVRRLVILIALVAGAYVFFLRATRITPPADTKIDLGHVGGEGTLRKVDGIWELTLRGDPAQLGAQHAMATRDLMRSVDQALMQKFHALPSPARLLIPRLARIRYRHLPNHIPKDRLTELAAEAQAYAPNDPIPNVLPTYHRLVFYHALYDIALGYEKSPLLGCSIICSVGLCGRNFDLEQDEFDTNKVVTRVAETGRIPYVSVGWAGMTGVVTGLSKAGIFVAVNGARAGQPNAEGVPLPFVLREMLQRANSIDEAVDIAKSMPVMVSHILFLADANGDTAVIERSPDRFVVHKNVLFVTNHFFDPQLAQDPHNQEIERISSTLPRYERLQQLAGRIYGREDVAAVLRDRTGTDGKPLAPGDRRAIDAGIATHSVIADPAARLLYVAQGPHTGGHYVAFSPP
jgi:hypothetical protein